MPMPKFRQVFVLFPQIPAQGENVATGGLAKGTRFKLPINCYGKNGISSQTPIDIKELKVSPVWQVVGKGRKE
jgi:hypothetical protein